MTKEAFTKGLRASAFVAIVLLSLGNVAFQLRDVVPVLWSRSDTVTRDAYSYYLAGERMHAGEELYSPRPPAGPHEPSVRYYLYPPFLSTVLGALPRVKYPIFARWWGLLQLLSLWIYGASLGKLVRGRFSLLGTLLGGLAVSLFPGALRAVGLGQIDPSLWALFGVALAFPAARGAAFMASALVKIYALWPFLLAGCREGRRVLVPGMAVLTAGVLAGIVAMGPLNWSQTATEWFIFIVPALGQGQLNPDNVSLSFAGLRLARSFGWEYVGGELPAWVKVYLSGAGIAAPVLTTVVTRGYDPLLRYSLVGCAAVLFAPLCWSGYLPILLAPGAILLGRMVSDRIEVRQRNVD